MKKYFETRYTYDPGRKEVWKAIVQDLQKYINENNSVIDLGAGYGDFINLIKCRKKYAVDTDYEYTNYYSSEVEFIQSDSSNLQLIKEGSIDVVFASNLLEHLSKKQLIKTISEISRITHSGSALILIQPNYRYAYRNYFDDFTHVTIFTHISIQDWLMTNNFKTIRIVPRYLPLTMKSFLPKNYFLTKLYLLFPLKIMGGQMLIIAKKQ